jgi:ferredoxin
MATIITQECINCGACEPECPNTAIYQGGVEYEHLGKKSPALQAEIFYIVPEKCTECVGFFDYEACAAVCPVDCCVTDPDRPENEDVLMARARELHPEKEFPGGFPSRFNPGRTAGGEKPAPPAAGASAPPVTPTAAPQQVSARATASVGRVERALPRRATPLQSGDPVKSIQGGLDGAFAEVMAAARRRRDTSASRWIGAALLAAAPIIGALPHGTKKSIEAAAGPGRWFSAQMSTALNVVHNFIVYPLVFYVVGLLVGLEPFTEADKTWIVCGVLLALAETTIRLRDGIFGQRPVDQMKLGASLYGAPLGVLLNPILKGFLRSMQSGQVPVEGFYGREFEAKRERERRYGEVYTVEEFDRGYYIRLELPRQIPPTATRDELALGEAMPDYDVSVKVAGSVVTVRGRVVDPELRAVCGISPAFPADFRTEIPLSGRLGGFQHRYADKVLELAVLKARA